VLLLTRSLLASVTSPEAAAQEVGPLQREHVLRLLRAPSFTRQLAGVKQLRELLWFTFCRSALEPDMQASRHAVLALRFFQHCCVGGRGASARHFPVLLVRRCWGMPGLPALLELGKIKCAACAACAACVACAACAACAAWQQRVEDGAH
jgi:hypothetical protein